MAAALAAVDARFAKKEPKAEEMDSFAEDLQIGEVVDEFSDEHEDFEEGEMDFIDDEIHIDVDDDFDEPEAFQDDGVEEDVAIADSTAINALKRNIPDSSQTTLRFRTGSQRSGRAGGAKD